MSWHWKRITSIAMLERAEFQERMKEARKLTREEQQIELRKKAKKVEK